MNGTAEFRKAVRKHFAFLDTHDFCSAEDRTEGEACWLTHKSPRVSILLCYGPPEFEVSLSFWLNSAPEMTLGVGDLQVVGQRAEAWKATPGTEGLEHQVSWFAAAVRSVESRLCTGDPLFYELMSSARRAALADWKHGEKTKAMRSAADTAWKEKRYTDVVRLYRSESAHLTPSERKRLEYAAKKAKAAKT